MLYNIHYDVCAVVVHLFALFFVIYKKGLRKLQNKVYLTIISAGLITTIFDIASAWISSYITEDRIPLGLLLNYAYLILHNLMPIFFCIYIVVVSGYYLKTTKAFYIKLLLPTVITVSLFLMNPFNKGIFYYDEELNYCHGPHMIWLYFSAVLYMTICVLLIIQNRTSIMRNKKVALLAMFVGGISSVGIQVIFPDMLIEMFVQGLALLGVLFTIENEDEMQSGITGIYNRKAFIYDNIVTIKNRIDSKVITIRFTNLKYYIEVLGVVHTNEVLKDIAIWLESVSLGTVYDCDNGLFAVAVRDNKTQSSTDVVKRLKDKFSEDWICGDIKIPFTTHICVIDILKDADTIERLLAILDTEYVCEASQRVTIIEGDRLHMFQRENMVSNAIQRALDNHSFKVFYQPIWDKVSNTIHSAEALLRLFDDELGFVPPDEFIPIAEKNGTIVKIGEFVFEDVCKMFSEYHIENYGISFIEVNLSTVQCMQKDLAKKFKEILDKYGVPASSINLEITESAAVNSPEMFLNTMAELKEMGFTFSMDDYGTGYSNYSYMFDLDFDIIKLDKSILWNADKNEKADIILKNTVRMIKEMKHNIVMEGVETEEQKKYVTSLGCDYCQGYYFSKPVDKANFIDYCKAYNDVEVSE